MQLLEGRGYMRPTLRALHRASELALASVLADRRDG